MRKEIFVSRSGLETEIRIFEAATEVRALSDLELLTMANGYDRVKAGRTNASAFNKVVKQNPKVKSAMAEAVAEAKAKAKR